jgi:agmatinase
MTAFAEFIEKNSGFIGCAGDYPPARVVLVGAPMDGTVSFRAGAREGPRQIRQVSQGLEEYSVDLDRDLAECCYYDAGDLVLPPGNVPESLRRISLAAGAILRGGKFPLFLGGEHLISYAVLREAVKLHPGLAVVHLDAHADLRDEYLGERFSHATVMRRVAELIGGENLYQFGIRSGARDEFVFARDRTNIYLNRVVEPLAENLPRLKGKPVYVTLDIDVVDPAYAPGTGTAEPGGCTAGEIIQAVHLLGQLNLVGFDLVEVSPVYDHSQRTALLAAKLVREVILCKKPA